jgi:pyruvate dehydrogenase E1 component
MDALEVERFNRLNPDAEQKVPYVKQQLQNETGSFVFASDYVQMLPDAIAKYLPKKLHSLGTYGFGRSEDRASLRDFFEVDARHITLTALYALADEGKIKMDVVKKAIKDLGINPDKKNPLKD